MPRLPREIHPCRHQGNLSSECNPIFANTVTSPGQAAAVLLDDTPRSRIVFVAGKEHFLRPIRLASASSSRNMTAPYLAGALRDESRSRYGRPAPAAHQSAHAAACRCRPASLGHTTNTRSGERDARGGGALATCVCRILDRIGTVSGECRIRCWRTRSPRPHLLQHLVNIAAVR